MTPKKRLPRGWALGSGVVAILAVALVLVLPGILPGTPETPCEPDEACTTGPAQLEFANRTWGIKSSTALWGPGPNPWSARQDMVWVDEAGALHLSITLCNGCWYCTEIYTTDSLGYGLYAFTVTRGIAALDPRAVLGLFTWDNVASGENYREIDVEFARWGHPANENGQFVVQPHATSGNMLRYNHTETGPSTHGFAWSAQRVTFFSTNATVDSWETLPATNSTQSLVWTYDGADVPAEGAPGAGAGAHAHINLWLTGGHPPATGQRVEVVLANFVYCPPGP